MANIRLPDPFTNPNEAPGFVSAPLVDNEPILQDELPNGKVKQVRSAAQFWSTTISYADLYESEYRYVMSAILESKRTGNHIEAVLPQYAVYRVFGDLTKCTIAAGQKGNSLVIGNTTGLTGRPFVNDLFQLSTDTKVYKITKVDVDLAAHTMTLGIYPDLQTTTVGVNEHPNFNEVKFQMVLMNRSSIPENINADGLYTGVSLALRETR